MANTVIALKKSATPTAQPTVLANGELAINYADGKLFYKHANGTILPFNTQGGNAFGTINANGTLVVAGSSEAVVTLIPGNNISISADAINDIITINSAGGTSVNIGDNPPVVATDGDLWWSSIYGSLFIYYNDGSSSQWVETSSGAAYSNIAETIAISAFDKANSANVLAYNTGIGANAFTSATIAGANTISIAAFDKANSALANTSGTFAGNLTVTGSISVASNLTLGTASAETPTGNAPLAFCRAWVNFNGTGTVAIRGSYNVTSITDNGTGDYTVNFATAMPDANYACVVTSDYGSSNYFNTTIPTTSTARVVGYITTSGAVSDRAWMMVAIFR